MTSDPAELALALALVNVLGALATMGALALSLRRSRTQAIRQGLDSPPVVERLREPDTGSQREHEEWMTRARLERERLEALLKEAWK